MAADIDGSGDRLGTPAPMLFRPAMPARPSGFRAAVLTCVYHRYSLLTALLLPLLVAAAFIGSRPMLYDARATILVLLDPSYRASVDLGSSKPLISLDANQTVQSEIEIINSVATRVGALRMLGIEKVYPPQAPSGFGFGRGTANNAPAADPKAAPVLAREQPATDAELGAAERMGGELTVFGVPNSNVIHLGVAHPDRLVAAQLLNTLVAVYMERRADIYEHASVGAMSAEQDRYAARLRDAESEMAKYAADSRISNFDEQVSLLLNEHARLANALRTADERLRVLNDGVGSPAARLPAVANGNTANSLGEALRSLEESRRAVLDRAGSNPAAIVELDGKIAALRTEIGRRGANASVNARSSGNSGISGVLRTPSGTDADRETLQVERASLEAALNQTQARLDDLNALGAHFRELKQARDVLQDTARNFARHVEEQRIADGLDPFKLASVRVIQAAEPPISGHRAYLWLLGPAAALGALLALLWLAMLSLTRKTVLGVTDAMRDLDLPVLLSVPERRLIETRDPAGRTPQEVRRDARRGGGEPRTGANGGPRASADDIRANGPLDGRRGTRRPSA